MCCNNNFNGSFAHAYFWYSLIELSNLLSLRAFLVVCCQIKAINNNNSNVLAWTLKKAFGRASSLIHDSISQFDVRILKAPAICAKAGRSFLLFTRGRTNEPDKTAVRKTMRTGIQMAALAVALSWLLK